MTQQDDMALAAPGASNKHGVDNPGAVINDQPPFSYNQSETPKNIYPDIRTNSYDNQAMTEDREETKF